MDSSATIRGNGGTVKHLPPGVIISAVTLILLSLLQLLSALAMGVSAIRYGLNSVLNPTGPAAAGPPWMPVSMLLTCGFFAALAIWESLTAVGLFRIRRWARDSVLVIGGAWPMFGLLSLFLTQVMRALPGAVPPSVAHPQIQNVPATIRVVIVGFPYLYPIMCAVGVSWLVYFNLAKVRELFESSPGKTGESGRPLLISAVALLSAIQALPWLMFAFLPYPGVFMGMIVHGWLKVIVNLVVTALMGAAGFGLWRLLEWGRRTALALQAFLLAQRIVYLVQPSLIPGNIKHVNRTINPAQPQPTWPLHDMMFNMSFAISVLFIVAIVVTLHHYRAAFMRPTAPLQAATPDLH